MSLSPMFISVSFSPNSSFVPRSLHANNKSSLCCSSRRFQLSTSQYDKMRHQGTLRMDMDSKSREHDRSWRDAIRAVMDDYVQSSRNICIGDGPRELLLPLLDAIDVHVHATSIVDVAFVATTPKNTKLLSERSLPTDLNVNFRRGIHTFIAPARVIDNRFNVVFESSFPSVDATAAQLADNCIFIVPQQHANDTDDLISSKDQTKNATDHMTSIQSFPIQLNPLIPDATAKSLAQDPVLRSLGVKSVVYRNNNQTSLINDTITPIIADVNLFHLEDDDFEEFENVTLVELYNELRRHPCVTGIGLHIANAKTTIVLAPESNNADPVDITTIHSTLATRANEMRKAAVDDLRREQVVASELQTWRSLSGPVSSITATFSFKHIIRSNAFVRAVQDLARTANHHPEIRQNFTQVRICLSTYEAGGVTELDILLAKEISRVYRVMRGSTRVAANGSSN